MATIDPGLIITKIESIIDCHLVKLRTPNSAYAFTFRDGLRRGVVEFDGRLIYVADDADVLDLGADFRIEATPDEIKWMGSLDRPNPGEIVIRGTDFFFATEPRWSGPSSPTYVNLRDGVLHETLNGAKAVLSSWGVTLSNGRLMVK
jgi:hypothetical protein